MNLWRKSYEPNGINDKTQRIKHITQKEISALWGRQGLERLNKISVNFDACNFSLHHVCHRKLFQDNDAN